MTPHSVSWSALPDALAERILQQAFTAGGCAVRDWVTLSLVCRTWKAVLDQTPASVKLPLPRMPNVYNHWLEYTKVPVRTMVFTELLEPFEDALKRGWPREDRMQCHVACRFDRISATIADNLEELEGIAVPPTDTWDCAVLQRFRRLRNLSLLDVEFLRADDCEQLVDNLPASLERLHMTMVSPVQGEDFDRLTRLRVFHLDLVPDDHREGDTWLDTEISEFNMAGLPPSLERLVVTDKKMLAVTLVPVTAAEPKKDRNPALGRGPGVHADSPAAAARHVRVDSKEVELRSSPAGSVAGAAAGLALEICARDALFELPPGVSTDGTLTSGESAKTVMRYLAAWLTASGARSVRLEPQGPRPYSVPHALSNSMGLSFKAGKRQGMHVRHVFTDADEMLRCMQPLCAARGLKCSGGSHMYGALGGVLMEPV